MPSRWLLKWRGSELDLEADAQVVESPDGLILAYAIVRRPGAFAVVALTLAIIGLYGLISFGVTQRTRELGVRVALGARRADIIGLVLREGLRLAIAGIVIGVACAFVATRLLKGMLYHVGVTDVTTFVTVPLVLLSTAVLANYLPARRAARVDPVVALQAE